MEGKERKGGEHGTVLFRRHPSDWLPGVDGRYDPDALLKLREALAEALGKPQETKNGQYRLQGLDDDSANQK